MEEGRRWSEGGIREFDGRTGGEEKIFRKERGVKKVL